MAQITIYLPDDLEKKARKAAKTEGTSVSRWIRSEVEHRLDDALPQAVLDAAGACPDFPDIEELRKDYGEDVPRERFD
jgi:hypothetical protein